MNGNSKYSNVLTMLLVVFIVAILGVIVYFAYDLLNSKKVDSNAQATIDEFQKATTPVTSDHSSLINSRNGAENEVETNTLDLSAFENALAESYNIVEAQTQATAPKETEKVYMEEYEVVGTIKIPKTKIEYPILDRITTRSLELAVALVPNGPGLNQVGNSVIFGHNYRNNLFFSNNKNLTKGDIIYITDKTGETVTYEIYNIYQTDPTDADYFGRDTEGRREISLQTCTDDSSARIIIWAKEKI